MLDKFDLDTPKTKTVSEFLQRFELTDALFVLPEKDEVFFKSARNIPTVTVLPSEGLNVYDVLKRKNLVLTQGALEAVTQRLTRAS